MAASLLHHAQQLLALITGAGVGFAYFQLQNATRSRLAGTYLAISKEWDALIGARTLITMSAFEGRDLENHTSRGTLLLEILDRHTSFLQGDIPTSIENEILCRT